jgi:shikimate 5-dehydrogenase
MIMRFYNETSKLTDKQTLRAIVVMEFAYRAIENPLLRGATKKGVQIY